MRLSSLIGHTLEAFDLARTSRKPSDLLLKEFFRKRKYLGSTDRRFIAESYYGLLRNFRLLEFTVSCTSITFPAAPPSIALYATYAITLLHQDPVLLLPELSGLWRVFIPDGDCGEFLASVAAVDPKKLFPASDAERMAIEYSLPEAVVTEWSARFGREEAEQLCLALNEPAPIAIRANSLKCSPDECRTALEREGFTLSPGAISPWALHFDRRLNVTAVRAFQEGWFEMQDEGSQLISMLLEVRPGSTVVDACAGGGGKTLHLAALMENQGNLLAVDIDNERLGNIEQRIARAGASIVKILHGERDAAVLESWTGKAEAVLVDAPCTGVGVFRRNPGAKMTFSTRNADALAETQRTVLERSSRYVAAGGRLVYATCSLLRRENEDLVEVFLAGHPEFVPLSAAEILARGGVRIASDSANLLLLPHRTTTDGFFAAVLERSAR